jgi:hypothetical protein
VRACVRASTNVCAQHNDCHDHHLAHPNICCPTGSPIRKFKLQKLTELSYESLAREAIALTVSLEESHLLPTSQHDYNVTFKYEDVDKDLILVASTEELVNAIQEFAGQRFIHLTAAVAPKYQSPAPPVTPATPSPTVASIPPPRSTLTTPQKRKAVSPAKKKKRVFATPSSGGTSSYPAPAPAHVASMPPTDNNTQEASPPPSSRRKPRVDYLALDQGTVSSPSEEEREKVASCADVKKEVKKRQESDQEEPPKKKSRQAGGDSGPLRSDKICHGLAELRALGMQEPSRIHVARSAGYTNAKSTGFTKQLGLLKKGGIVDYQKGNRLKLTEHGLQSVPKVDPPEDNAAAQARLRMILKLSPKKNSKKGKQEGSTKSDLMFDILSDGQVHERQKLALATGYTNIKSTGFTKVLGTMRSLGLIRYIHGENPGVQLTNIAFPLGIKQEMP